ncbi:LolA-like putative outer membrane lipoprotein chaperone [Parabacteroides sp. Marseille-P3160]|uniref:LolA family protein n=1 Tax=Parabacteroides sp. Marseille-P3160 TaxID=1917887 RepID=UPI0009BBE4A1|nr:LolA-like putative outer membrane lipoprotein chaperone [Parabacteroides sp. Marseille-P3160]
MKQLVIALFIGLFIYPATAQNADGILDKAAQAYEQSNGIKATFSMHARSDKQKISESFEGTISMKGNKFHYSTPDMQVWFDGKTQWTYMERTDEVNVTTPTGEELQQINPMLILKSYKNGYKATYKGQSTAPNGKAAYDIVLTPKSGKDIEKIELQIEKNNNLPTSVIINAKNGLQSTIRINKIQTGINQADATFVFRENNYPNAEIIDLR